MSVPRRRRPRQEHIGSATRQRRGRGRCRAADRGRLWVPADAPVRSGVQITTVIFEYDSSVTGIAMYTLAGQSSAEVGVGSPRTRSRSRRTARPPFRAWGFLLLCAFVLLLYTAQWVAATWVAAVLLFYFFAVRVTLCRVETQKRRPCRWRVRGFLNTCNFHVGLKHGMPRFINSEHALTLPMLMWPRSEVELQGAPEPQPARSRGFATLAPNAKRTAGSSERLMKWTTIAGAIIALASFARDVIAG